MFAHSARAMPAPATGPCTALTTGTARVANKWIAGPHVDVSACAEMFAASRQQHRTNVGIRRLGNRVSERAVCGRVQRIARIGTVENNVADSVLYVPEHQI